MEGHSYIHVRWIHDAADDPVHLWGELDASRMEVRKVEVWADGRVAFAGPDVECYGSRLGEAPVPPIDEIAANPEFAPEVITREAFEEAWEARVRTGRPLSGEAFTACFADPMQDVTETTSADVDIWPYVDALDRVRLGLPEPIDVYKVYRDAQGRYDQVLVGTDRSNSFLVVVVDLKRQVIHGHRLLDLNRLYGLKI